jgi:Fur family zinc uptake transcriptional regulator
MNSHAHGPADLTKNQSLVMDALASARGPLSAYTILDQLRDHGFRAPLQVYRALDKLVDAGLVHRLESLNAFVACRHPGCDDHELIAFMICDNCDQVTEISDDGLAGTLARLANQAGFSMKKAAIELRGVCAQCDDV